MRRPLLSTVLAPTSFTAVFTIALRLGAGSTIPQQGRAFDIDARGRSAGCVAQPTSVTMAIVLMMKRNRSGLPYMNKPALGRLSKLIDVFMPGDGKWHSGGQFFNQ